MLALDPICGQPIWIKYCNFSVLTKKTDQLKFTNRVILALYIAVETMRTWILFMKIKLNIWFFNL